MTELDEAVQAAFTSSGGRSEVNKVYLALVRTLLFVPVEKNPVIISEDEPFRPLFANVNGNYFMLVFDSQDKLANWAGEHYADMNYVEISGRDVIAGVGDQVFLGLNLGTDFYKEFSPDEVKRVKTIVARIDQLRQG
jgi:hypothetical protein